MALNSSPAVERRLVRIASNGRVDVVAEPRDDVDVEGNADVVAAGGTTTITSAKGRLRIRVPVGADLTIGTPKGPVTVSGDVRRLSVVTDSGTVAVKRAQTADIRSNTGRIDITQSDGNCRVRSKSGTISVASCHRADVATGSGRITLLGVRGPVQAHCTSGRIAIEMAAANDVQAETVTGRIAVSLPRGVRAFHTEAIGAQAMPDGADCIVLARSVSGRIDVSNR